jgi:propanediol dehydratase small subunit
MEPGEHWDWGGVLYALYDETDGSDEAFLQIADELREEYQNGLID